MIYVYAITDLSAPPALSAGIDGLPLLLHRAQGIGALCSEHKEAQIAPTAQRIWQHEKVVEAAMELGAVLPVRFGSCFDDRMLLDDLLRTNGSLIQAALHHVRGCVEMGVRVIDKFGDGAEAQNPPPPRNGREYLLRRAAHERCLDARREKAAALHDELSAATVDARMRAPAADVLLSGAYLIARDQIDDFRRRVHRISGAHPDMRIVATGPWPPHHFVPALQLKEHSHA